MGKFQVLKGIMNTCGFYSQEEMKNMSEKELKAAEARKITTGIVGGTILTCCAFIAGKSMGKSIGKKYKDNEWIGIYNSGANDMYNGLNSKWEKIPPLFRKYIKDHIDLANAGLVANGR